MGRRGLGALTAGLPLGALTAALLLLGGCVSTVGPFEADPEAGRAALLAQLAPEDAVPGIAHRADWGPGRLTIQPYPLLFDLSPSQRSGVLVANESGVAFYAWSASAGRYSVGRRWTYPELRSASVFRPLDLGYGGILQLRHTGGVDAIQLTLPGLRPVPAAEIDRVQGYIAARLRPAVPAA